MQIGLTAIAGLILTATSSFAQSTPPHIAKSFGAATIGVGGSTNMDIQVSNTGVVDLNTVTFTDTIPAGIVVSTPNGLLTACTPGSFLGPVSAVAGGSSVALGSSVILAGGVCTVLVNITGVTSGLVVNSVQASDDSAGDGNTAAAAITVLPGSAPSITKVFGASSIPFNGTTSLTFTLSGTDGLTAASFSDLLPAGLVVATPNGLTNACSGTATATAGSSSVSLTGVTFAGAGSCTMTVNVTGTTVGAKVNNVQAIDAILGAGPVGTATVTVLGSADLSITKSAAGTVNAGQNIVYTITVTNNGPSAATSVSVADPTPANTTFVSNTGGCTTTFPCSLGTINSGASVVITSTFNVNSGTSGGTNITNTATVSSAVNDPTPANNTFTTTSSVGVSADVAITKTGPSSAIIASNMTYNITVSNSGPSTATGVSVTDVVPTGTSFVSATPSTGTCTGSTTVTCTIGTLASGGTATIALVVRLNVVGPISNTATVSATTADPNLANNTATLATNSVPVNPAPSTWLLLCTGLLGLMGWSRWRSRLERPVR
jgi:trimeric autotransporter adhesin